MSTITEFRSSNVKRLTAVQLTPPATGAVVIGGKNRQGKSSVLDSILYALGGASALPGVPVRTGEEQADIELTINTVPPLIVRRRIKADGGTSLELRQKSGDGIESKVSKPQNVLNSLVGTVAFDPLAFTAMKPQDQIATLQTLAGVDTDVIDKEINELSEKRKTRKRDLETFEAVTQQMPHHPDLAADTAVLDPAELSKELQQAQEHNARCRDIAQGIEEKEASLLRAQESIQLLKRQLADAETMEQEIREDLQITYAMRDTLQPVDLQPILERSQQISEHNRKLAENTKYRERLHQQTQSQGEIDKITAQIEDLRSCRIEAMSNATWPVDGLGFDTQGVTYNGLPFTQCSSAEQLRISTAIGMAQNPKLNLMLVRDGSLLDEDHLALLHELAIEHGAQVWIERVSRGEECFVVIEDGGVKIDRVPDLAGVE